MDPQTAALIRQQKQAILNHANALNQQSALLRELQQAVIDLQSRPRSVAEEIDAIEGRRLAGTLSGEITFDINDQFTRGEPITFNVSADGPFVMTHYPLVLWRPSAPDDATNLGRWRPVSTFPLPSQVVDADIIDLMYELYDGGSKRMFQNEAAGPLFSRPDNIVPLPLPTLFGSNSVVQFFPNYLRFSWFDPAGDEEYVAPTEGTLHVDLVGYYIANL